MEYSNVIIIAEAGVNHNGEIDLAKKLIDVAAVAGADYIKFQTWITEELIDFDAPKATYQKENDGEDTSQYEMLKKLELSFDDFRELKSYCEQKKIKFLSTPDEERSLDFLCDELMVDIIKIGSGEITNIPFLKQVGLKKKDVILSTGMSNIGEVERAYNELICNGAKSVTLLHCTSNYPASFDSINLKAMNTLGLAFNTFVGYSDHTEGISVSLAAVALGAKVIEKHFTLDKGMKGPDHKASMSPLELAMLVSEIRNIESALSGSGAKVITSSEKETKKVVAKGLYLKEDLKEGDILSENILIAKRPIKGIPVEQYYSCLGKRVNKNKNKGEFLTWSDISFE